MAKIGVFGGTFNPVHLGHEHLVKEMLSLGKLDKIVVMPSKIPPHKQAKNLASEIDRFNMCKIAFQEYENVEISDYEFTREGKSYSYYTISYLRQIYPNDELYFIMGSDMLLSFHEWFRYKDLFKMCDIICISRNTDDSEKLESYANDMKKFGNVLIVNVKPVEMSSTQIRQMLKKHEECSCYLNKNVVQYIEEKKLY